jgi:hypothetical protein
MTRWHNEMCNRLGESPVIESQQPNCIRILQDGLFEATAFHCHATIPCVLLSCILHTICEHESTETSQYAVLRP